MLTKRIIPCLDVKEGRVVKGVNFVGLVDAGDPVEIAKMYNEQGADEITFLDITASHEKRKTILDVVERTAEQVFIPFTVGGGISTVEDMRALLLSGADKISINSSAVNQPALINQGAEKFGSQCIVVAIDAKKKEKEDGWDVYIYGGRKNTGMDLIQWVKEAENRGAGEILLTSMDADGTKNGYDLEMVEAVSKIVRIPVVASGGAGSKQHFAEAFQVGAHAALAASLFHFKELEVKELKEYLDKQNIPVRL